MYDLDFTQYLSVKGIRNYGMFNCTINKINSEFVDTEAGKTCAKSANLFGETL